MVNNQPGTSILLTVTSSGFTVTDDEDNVEIYNAAGVLQSITSRAGVVQTLAYDISERLTGVTDSFGNNLVLGYDTQGYISTATLNSAAPVQYAYDAAGRLATVTYQDNTTRNYKYGGNGRLASIVDENATTFSTWSYNAKNQANATQEAGGANAATLTYNADGSVTVTDSLGAVRTFSYSRVGDVNRPIAISGSQCPTCQEMAETTYDAAGWVSSRMDYNGNLTCYSNDPTRGLELVRVEGFSAGSSCPSSLSTYVPTSGTRQRKITTAWNTTFREPATITGPNRTTAYTYDTSGNAPNENGRSPHGCLGRRDLHVLRLHHGRRVWSGAHPDQCGRPDHYLQYLQRLR
jgi:YD repeat-containing protein